MALLFLFTQTMIPLVRWVSWWWRRSSTLSRMTLSGSFGENVWCNCRAFVMSVEWLDKNSRAHIVKFGQKLCHIRHIFHGKSKRSSSTEKICSIMFVRWGLTGAERLENYLSLSKYFFATCVQIFLENNELVRSGGSFVFGLIPGIYDHRYAQFLLTFPDFTLRKTKSRTTVNGSAKWNSENNFR